MIKRVFILSIIFVLFYVGLIKFQLYVARSNQKNKQVDVSEPAEAKHKLYVFSFAKYSPNGEKEIEIEGDSANILDRTVDLLNVVAKAYAEETAVTITADKGNYKKSENEVFLEKNVVATTDNGTRLLTEELTIFPTDRRMDTDVQAEVKKDNISIDGQGAAADTNLKKVRFKKNVTVMVQDPKDKSNGPTVITCDGTLEIDYEKNIAHFKDNVVAQDRRGKLTADTMDVYYNKVSRQVAKIIAIGNVVIENPDGNKTYSDNVIYLADEGRIILGGDIEALYAAGSEKQNEGELNSVFA